MKCKHQWFKIDIFPIYEKIESSSGSIAIAVMGEIKKTKVIYNCPNCEKTKIVMVDYNAKTKTSNKKKNR